MTAEPTQEFEVGRFGEAGRFRDRVAVEEPLEIRVFGRPIAVVMRTPGDDLDLVAGFVVTEGIADDDDVSAIAACVDARGAEVPNVVNVALVEGAELDVERFRRNLYATSSCGVCGKATLDAVNVASPPVDGKWTIDGKILTTLAARCRGLQTSFQATGGLHAAALFDRTGNAVVLREDVGRHNAVDKVIGARVRAKAYPLDEFVLFVTGRAGFEITQKGRVARIPMVVAVGAPSSLAIECAKEGKMTLVGFTKEGGFNVYCGGERIEGG